MAVRFRLPSDSLLDSSGNPLNAGTLTFYVTGTSTPKNTYTTEALSTANSNPITLDSAGRHTDIWLAYGAYKVVLKDSAGSTIKTMDPVYSGDEDDGITPQAYGAKADGVTDDLPAFKLAIIAAAAARLADSGIRRAVRVPPGKYLLAGGLPSIGSVDIYCPEVFGARLIPSGSMAQAIYSATLSGSTFTTNVGAALNQNCTHASLRNLFIDHKIAAATITDAVVSINGAPEANIENIYIETNANTINGFVFDHCVSPRLGFLRADKVGGATGGTGISLQGQTNAGVLFEPQVEGDWAIGTKLGGVRNKQIGGVIESEPTIGTVIAGEGMDIDGTWYEGCTIDIQLGDTGSTASNAYIDKTLHGGGGTNMFKIVEGTSFFWGRNNRIQTGASAYTNNFEAPASAGVCNGTIQLYGDPSTFTTSGANLSSKGAINIEVYGTSDTGDHQRLAIFSSATNRAIWQPGRDITTFTPALQFGGAAVDLTYAANGQVGYYWITESAAGKIVNFQIRLELTAKGSSTGDATISGLPDTSRNTTNLIATGVPQIQSVNLDVGGGYYTPIWQISPNTTVILLRETGDNVTVANLTDADFGNSSIVAITGQYFCEI